MVMLLLGLVTSNSKGGFCHILPCIILGTIKSYLQTLRVSLIDRCRGLSHRPQAG